MNALTVELSSEVHEKVDVIAAEKGVSPERLLSDMAAEMVMQHDAHRLFLEMAERGKGREAEALALLRRD
ncbi:toxin-antitoxin system HicB family antitoxin [Rhizobium glycinendophyticum]|uniref:Toxin-antitoxin system HicB family antitoxin n=1 Tax=Rhizobium glycinendophyticum TaxID=2589807 RepID=A0A504UW13_9HYPH|nr:toxin-antitoxin system HicB family antitoxin [Rhizobium glycinendophyticum]TPP10931.1 toxin-antitoxin system HicB family antitoxin [Rhizobium glycinendophyticum]